MNDKRACFDFGIVFSNGGGAALVGIDAPNVDDISRRSRPARAILPGAGAPIVEHLAGLDAPPASGFRFWATPPKVAWMGALPVRAHAILD